MNNNNNNKGLGFVTNILSNSFQEVILHYDVENLLNDMLSTVEMYYSEKLYKEHFKYLMLLIDGPESKMKVHVFAIRLQKCEPSELWSEH